MPWRWLFIVATLLICTACAPVISPEVRAGVDPQLSFTDIAANPEAHVGKMVLLAGTIIEAKNLREGTRLEVLQFPATRRGRPQVGEPSGGRFLVIAPGYLETEVYRPGRAITVAGRITGVREFPVGETVYPYPLLEPQELHLWAEGSQYPRVYIGLGFGFSKGF
jgi:outer membrane lipoprotein